MAAAHGLPDSKELESLLGDVLGRSRADSARVNVTARHSGFTRFAKNEVTTSGLVSDVSVAITCAFGQRHATAQAHTLAPEGLRRVLATAEQLARLAPEDPEWVPDLAPVRHPGPSTAPGPGGAAFDDSTATAPPQLRAFAVARALEGARKEGVVVSGLIDHSARVVAVANKKGLFGHHRETHASLVMTARTSDGSGSGWAQSVSNRAAQLEVEPTVARAIAKAKRSRGARPLPPGRYTVILEPAATQTFIAFLGFALNRRDAEEGRGAFARGQGQTRLGEKLFAFAVTVASEPASASLPVAPFDGEGQPRPPVRWIDRGVLARLGTSRHWARQRGIAPEPFPGNLIMTGGPHSLEALIKGCDKGLLVTRFWYANLVDPKTLLVTGLTRDGVFLVEKGTVTAPVRNFRFNQSVFDTLRDVEAIGPAVRTDSGYGFSTFPISAPPLLVRHFNMASTSDAV